MVSISIRVKLCVNWGKTTANFKSKCIFWKTEISRRTTDCAEPSVLFVRVLLSTSVTEIWQFVDSVYWTVTLHINSGLWVFNAEKRMQCSDDLSSVLISSGSHSCSSGSCSTLHRCHVTLYLCLSTSGNCSRSLVSAYLSAAQVMLSHTEGHRQSQPNNTLNYGSKYTSFIYTSVIFLWISLFFLCSEVCKLLYYTYCKVSARVCYIALTLKLLIHVLFFSL